MKNGRAFLSVIIVAVTFTNGAAQFTINNELYHYNYFTVNPAFAGKDGQNFSLLTTSTLYGLGSTNTDVLFAYDTKFDKINSGIGLIAQSLRSDPVLKTNLSFNYAYDLELGGSSSIRFGTRVENQRTSIDYSFFRSIDPVDPILGSQDVESISRLSVSLGAMLEIRDFYFAFSADNLMATGKSNVNVFNGKRAILFNSILGYSFKISSWGKLIHSVYAPLSGGDFIKVDLNNVLLINNKIITGVSLEIDDGTLFPKINAGYKWNDFIQITSMIFSKRKYET
jgi:type IX secretion system PorP/SprF family membrane protein